MPTAGWELTSIRPKTSSDPLGPSSAIECAVANPFSGLDPRPETWRTVMVAGTGTFGVSLGDLAMVLVSFACRVSPEGAPGSEDALTTPLAGFTIHHRITW